MSEPLISRDAHGIKEGKAEEFVKASHEVVDVLQANPTRHLYFAICMNEQGTAYSNFQIHPDSDSMLDHLRLLTEQVQAPWPDILDFSVGDEQLDGTPSDALLEQLAEWGTSVNRPIGGFSRLGQPGQTTSFSEPLVFVSSYALADGAGEDYKAALPEWFAWNEAEHPRLLHDKVYLSPDGARVTDVQVHPDVRSMELQMRLISGRLDDWQRLIDWNTMRIQLVGSPSDAVVDGLGRIAGPSVSLRVETPTVGFSRLPVG